MVGQAVISISWEPEGGREAVPALPKLQSKFKESRPTSETRQQVQRSATGQRAETVESAGADTGAG